MKIQPKNLPVAQCVGFKVLLTQNKRKSFRKHLCTSWKVTEVGLIFFSVDVTMKLYFFLRPTCAADRSGMCHFPQFCLGQLYPKLDRKGSTLRFQKAFCLTLPVPCISETCIEIKIKLNFHFHTSFKAFIKPFEASQRSVKIKISLNFFLFVRDWDGKG